jgi:hypothetical protein
MRHPIPLPDFPLPKLAIAGRLQLLLCTVSLLLSISTQTAERAFSLGVKLGVFSKADAWESHTVGTLMVGAIFILLSSVCGIFAEGSDRLRSLRAELKVVPDEAASSILIGLLKRHGMIHCAAPMSAVAGIAARDWLVSNDAGGVVILVLGAPSILAPFLAYVAGMLSEQSTTTFIVPRALAILVALSTPFSVTISAFLSFLLLLVTLSQAVLCMRLPRRHPPSEESSTDTTPHNQTPL